MTDESNWSTILQTVYEEDIWWEKDTEVDEDHPVVQETGMDTETVQSSLAYLSQVQLIGTVQAGMKSDVPRPGKESEMPVTSRDRRTGLYLGLTSRGFSVAHDREMRRRRDEQNQREAKQQHDVNLAIALLTLGLISVTVVDSAVQAFVGAGTILWAYSSLSIGVALLIIFTIILARNGLISRYSTEKNS